MYVEFLVLRDKTELLGTILFLVGKHATALCDVAVVYSLPLLIGNG